MASRSKLFLFDHPVSSYAQKVRIALREKGVDFDFETPQNMGTGTDNADLLAANPRHEVPALIDGDFKIFDSTIILQYLEEKYPQNPLLPKDLQARATARMIEEICDGQYEAINWGFAEVHWQGRATGALAEKLTAEVKKQTDQVLSWLETQLGGNDYFNGSTFGYADVCVAPVLNRSVINGTMNNAALKKWHERIQKHESIKLTFDEVAKAAEGMSKIGDFFRRGGRAREYRDHRLEFLIKSGGIDVVLEGLEKNNIRFCRLPNEPPWSSRL
jgi:glutathione S-transferase